MTPPDDYRIRLMQRADLDRVIEWAAAEGWNPGRHDAAAFFATDPTGFWLGELGGEPIASISAVKYGAGYAFVGFYIVKPEHRGRGYGLRLWQAALASVADRVVGLDGVVAQQENYRKSGFGLAYRNSRFEGMSGGSIPTDPGLVPLTDVPPAALHAYDRACYPAERAAFLAGWLDQPEKVALGLMRGGRLAGYGMARPSRTGYRIGPLFADTAEDAETLFAALKGSLPEGEPVFLDVPECNEAAVALATRHGMNSVFDTARMYTGAVPDLPMERIFGVTSLELG
jgi:GNAT superfamily N-acetyltransferase